MLLRTLYRDPLRVGSFYLFDSRKCHKQKKEHCMITRKVLYIVFRIMNNSFVLSLFCCRSF